MRYGAALEKLKPKGQFSAHTISKSRDRQPSRRVRKSQHDLAAIRSAEVGLTDQSFLSFFPFPTPVVKKRCRLSSQWYVAFPYPPNSNYSLHALHGLSSTNSRFLRYRTTATQPTTKSAHENSLESRPRNGILWRIGNLEAYGSLTCLLPGRR